MLLAAKYSPKNILVFAGTELLYKPLNPAPQEIVPGAETYPMRIAKPSQQENKGAATAAAADEAEAASEGVAGAERPQQTPEERAAAMAAAEKAVAPLASEDASMPAGADLPQICPAPAQARPVENGVLDNGTIAEHAEVSSPRALDELESIKEVAQAEPAPAESAPALQNGPVDTVVPETDSAQPLQDVTVPSSAPENPAAGQPDEAGVPIVVAAEADTAEAKPEVEAERAASSAGADLESRKRSRPADDAAPEQAPPEQAPAAEEAPAASEPAACDEEASRKKRKVVAAVEKVPDVAEGVSAQEVPEQSAQAAEPKMQKKRKAASADLDAVQAAGTASTTPESQPSKSLSRRSLRSNHALQDTAAAGGALDSVSKPAPAAEAKPETANAKAKAKPRRRGAAAELAALGQADVMPTDSPRHSNGQQPASRRALRSQTLEPDQAATPRAGQLASARQPASKRALRSQSSMPKDGVLSREGSRAGTAAASPEEGGMPLGSGQPGPGSLPGSAAVQRLLRRSMSPRRRTRSNAQEHLAAADAAAGGGCLSYTLHCCKWLPHSPAK